LPAAALLSFLRVLPVPAHTVEELIRLLRRQPVIGADIFDLQILATMNVNGIARIYTFNAADFASFPEFAVLTP
jgi:predicted nucleic acid-binding protein